MKGKEKGDHPVPTCHNESNDKMNPSESINRFVDAHVFEQTH